MIDEVFKALSTWKDDLTNSIHLLNMYFGFVSPVVLDFGKNH